MKRFLFLIGVALCLSTIKAGVYNNSGTTAEDSIAFVFQYLDSLGNPVVAAANDSVYISVDYPGGIEAFRDSMVYNDANITESAWEDLAGGEKYTLRYAVADIDGTPVNGTYKVTVTAHDNSLDLKSAKISEFQLYTTEDYSATFDFLVDSIQALLDSIQNQDNWIAKEASLLTASDNIGINWADIANPTTAVNLSATNIDVDQVIASVSGAVGSVTAGVTLAAGQFTKIKDTVVAFLNNYDPTSDSVIVDGSIFAALVDIITSTNVAASANNEMARAIWSIAGPDDTTYAGGTMGKDAELWDATGASGGVDSTVLSNMLRRVIFGIAVGSGSDSTTLSQRKILVEDMINAVEASIYAEFISGSNEDAFKANVSALALEASLYDPATDSTIVDVSAANTAGGLIPLTEDAVYANRNDYKADVSAFAYFDTLIYNGGVWVDAGANENTVVGVDGTPKNPVGTIAAAKTIADALGFATIYFLDGASETIGATMEHYRFVGVTRSATVNLGGQDVDGSFFECLTITGTQGGTGLIVVMDAGLSTLDSLEIHARNCAIMGPISLKGGIKTNTFDKCYSSIAGNDTPSLNFNDASDSIYVNWRAYSGGLELLNMTTNHVMSYETDGQLVINANSDNGNVSVRGNVTITDNGTTMSITKDAVFSRQELIPLQAVESADSNLVNAASYKADVSALALEASVSTAQDSLNILTGLTREMQADVDSMILFDGYCTDCRSIAGPDSETDTLSIYKGATRLMRFLYWHIGGATGNDADSTTVLDN